MDQEKVAKHLAKLQALGMRVRIEPEFVVMKISRLDVICPDRNTSNTRVLFQGVEFQSWLASIDVRLAVGEVPRADVVFGLIP